MLRQPNIGGLRPHPLTGEAALESEILSEQASALGEAGRKVEAALARLSEAEASGAGNAAAALHAAAKAVHAYFIQRELCGFRNHDAIIRDMAIPGRVLARLGAR